MTTLRSTPMNVDNLEQQDPVGLKGKHNSPSPARHRGVRRCTMVLEVHAAGIEEFADSPVT